MVIFIHCVIIVKVNRGIDVDVVVAEVRETSRKPDEVRPVYMHASSCITGWHSVTYCVKLSRKKACVVILLQISEHNAYLAPFSLTFVHISYKTPL